METVVNGSTQQNGGGDSTVSNGNPTDQSSDSVDPYFSDVFRYRNGYMYCEDMCVTDIKHWLRESVGEPTTPFFVYSRAKLASNVNAYLDAFGKTSRACVLNYALKANMNPNIALLMKNLGCSATLVSGLELRMALDMGFEPQNLVLNGNGKQDWEVGQAVSAGCLLNVDSAFNLQQTAAACRKLDCRARVLLRVNPNIDAEVHSYITTGTYDSKFGVAGDVLQELLDEIKQEPRLELVGLHCHLGSTITSLAVFRRAAKAMTDLFHRIKSSGFPSMTCINLGGGLGIPYAKHAAVTKTPSNGEVSIVDGPVRVPSPAEVVSAIDECLAPGVRLILEPGRSLVGNTAALLSTVLGVKHCPKKSYINVDGAMTEVIRPALYGAYHHADLATPPAAPGCERRMYDVVGPVCESGDFLAKDRYLATPERGDCLAVFDVGAYCSSMASNYNWRPRCAEVLVAGERCTLIRRPDTYESMMAPYLPVRHGEDNQKHKPHEASGPHDTVVSFRTDNIRQQTVS